MKRLYKTSALLIILAVLVALFLANKYYFKAQPKPGEAETALFTITASDIDKIEINSDNLVIKLIKENDQWYLVKADKNFLADQELLNNLLTNASQLKKVEVVSRNKEKWSNFGLAEKEATEIILSSQAKTAAHFFLGKNGSIASSQYLRLAGEDSVILVKESLEPDLKQSETAWRNHQVLNFNSARIKKISLVEKKQTLELNKNGEEWEITQPQTAPADQAAVKQLLDSLANLQADDLAQDNDPGKYNLNPEKAQLQVILTLDNDTTLEILVGDQEGSQYYVKNEQLADVFKVNKSKAEKFWQKVEDFKKTESEK